MWLNVTDEMSVASSFIIVDNVSKLFSFLVSTHKGAHPLSNRVLACPRICRVHVLTRYVVCSCRPLTPSLSRNIDHLLCDRPVFRRLKVRGWRASNSPGIQC